MSLKVETSDLAGDPFRIGEWLVELSLNRLSRGDTSIRLELQVMNVLVCLAGRAGDVVPRQEIVNRVWATEFVSDNSLTQAIKELRNAFGDDARNPSFIETIHRRGYRLIASVETTIIQDRSAISKRWPYILAVVIAAIIALLFIFPPQGLFEGSVEQPAEVALPRIVVLPFENLGPPEDEYFADGITDEVRGKLFRLAGLEVIARYSSDQYRGTTKPLSQIADELGARFLLTAKVQWQKSDDETSRVRVSPELVEVQPGAAPVAMWHDAFDATLADVFQVQANIATRVAHALDVTLSADDQHALDLLEPLLEVPFYLSPGWLSIDPLSDPLRDHPRFQALLEEYDTDTN